MNARPATLVVIEFGASWPRWLNPSGDRGDLAVVAQQYETILDWSALDQWIERIRKAGRLAPRDLAGSLA